MRRCFLNWLAIFFILANPVLMSGCSSSTDMAEAENPAVAREIEKYLADDFGMPGYQTSWYRNIIGVSVRGSTVDVVTNLAAKGQQAENICGAVSGFVFSNQNRPLGLNNVRVIGQNGQVLINRRGVSERCA